MLIIHLFYFKGKYLPQAFLNLFKFFCTVSRFICYISSLAKHNTGIFIDNVNKIRYTVYTKYRKVVFLYGANKYKYSYG